MKQVFKAYFGHWPIILYLVIALSLILASFLLAPQIFLKGLLIFFVSISLAPFFEWVLHKYSLHRIVDPKLSPRTYKYMLNLHYRHHWSPNNLSYVFAPLSAAFILFIAFVPVAFLLFDQLSFSLLFIASIIIYFLYYEWIHLAHHIPEYRAKTSFGKHMRKAHSWHHYKNENYWWGVTNPLGDYVLGTFKDPKEVEFSPSAKSLGELERAIESLKELERATKL